MELFTGSVKRQKVQKKDGFAEKWKNAMCNVIFVTQLKQFATLFGFEKLFYQNPFP